MSTDSSKNERKKVAIDEGTYNKLKTFSRLNAVKTRTVLETLVDVMLVDDALGARIVKLALERDADKSQ